ncbi:helix-turn-helix domain-containing protein [Guptibacillus hwajinpoensis]|uniref:XRE family transcriptional regulator n=1 Tax=Guptibacillus hwajinpoensis TaxID=208199 RepID=A0A0J6CIG9_9BACL|nr:helix-turn-helix transcriptional regulator [Alkalihalobacillus macyae]KMM36011.1 XRE family transcriptional regulator [Alkalihalobacillus macyae]
MEEEVCGRRIRAFRKLKGYTQEQLAKQLGISVSILGEIERGNRKPTKDFMQLVAEQLRVPLRELFPTEENQGMR